MIIYLAFFLIPAFVFLSNPKISSKQHTGYFIFSLILVFLIGYRQWTGGDWGNYYHQFSQIDDVTLINYIFSGRYSGEYAFNTLFWLGHQFGDFYSTNTLFAAISFYALYQFAKNQPYFWLTITLAVPFFIVIMVMGYTRQGLALSILMLAILDLAKGKPLRYLAWVALATGLHNSAFVFAILSLPYFIRMSQYRVIGLMILFPAALFGMGTLESYVAIKVQHYIVEAGYEGSYMSSSGALIRILINAAAGAAFFYYRKQWQTVFPNDYPVWQLLSIATLVSIPLLFVASSTSVDRMALYLLMLQLAVWPRIIYLSSAKNRKTLMLGCITAYGGILVIWLNYADNVWMWLPYRHYLLGTF
jgi:hypothetical protein